MKLNVNDRVGYQGIDYRVDDILTYALIDRSLRVARLVAAGEVRFLESPTRYADDRALVLAEIAGIDITTPPPATIYHRGESYLLQGNRCGEGDNRWRRSTDLHAVALSRLWRPVSANRTMA